MTRDSRFYLVLGAVALHSVVDYSPAAHAEGGKADPKVEKARLDYTLAVDDLQAAHWRRLREAKEKHGKTARQEKVAATKQGDLELAKAWEAMEALLKPALVNIASQGTAQVSRTGEGRGEAGILVDGVVTAPDREWKKYWWPGAGKKDDWIQIDFKERQAIRQVRFSAPLGTAWNKNGHEPVDYEISLKTGDRERESITVRGGRHSKKIVSDDKKWLWAVWELKDAVAAASVKLKFLKSSGRDGGPIVFEVEVLEEPHGSNAGALPTDVDPKVQRAWADQQQDVSLLEVDLRRKHRTLKEEHRAKAESRKAEAAKRGDLDSALAWEGLAKELQPVAENFAPRANVSVCARKAVGGGPEVLTDGKAVAEFREPKQYWHAGASQKPDWVRLELGQTLPISAVRFSSPIGTRWHTSGGEPLDYDVLLKSGKTIHKLLSVREGKHLKAEPHDGGRTQWVTVDFAEAPAASEVEIHSHRTSGAGLAPVLFEVEVLVIE